MNALIDCFADKKIGITSIGMDGEPFDNVTLLPKPRIKVYPGFLVATTIDCLQASDTIFEILYESGISTPLGVVVLARIIKTGHCLIAGPSSIVEMEKIVGKLKEYKADKILVDGAFSRQSTAKLSDATILCIGANRSPIIDEVVKDAHSLIERLSITGIDKRLMFLDDFSQIATIDETGKVTSHMETSVITEPDKVLEILSEKTKYLFLPNAVTTRFAVKLLKNKHASGTKIIMKTPLNFMSDDQAGKHIKLLKDRLYVLRPVNLVAICYNPYSPRGYSFDNQLFFDKLREITDIPLINVLQKESDDRE